MDVAYNINSIDFHIPELDSMKSYPKDLYYIGNLDLLNKRKIGVVGSRSPNSYSRELTRKIISSLANTGNIIVSGGAMGIDTIAHQSAGSNKTIMIAGTGLDIRYPAINKKLIQDIEQNGLVLSKFAPNTPSLPRNFAIRNELIVALSDILIVSYADIKSGTMRSVEYALQMGKKIYVLPHRIGESDGTNKLLAEDKVSAIYDINKFIAKYSNNVQANRTKEIEDSFLEFCSSNPTYEDAIKKDSSKLFEYELSGKIFVQDGLIKVS